MSRRFPRNVPSGFLQESGFLTEGNLASSLSLAGIRNSGLTSDPLLALSADTKKRDLGVLGRLRRQPEGARLPPRADDQSRSEAVADPGVKLGRAPFPTTSGPVYRGFQSQLRYCLLV